jgi:hypothetical protein
MEPMGIERHGRSPQGERAGANESTEAQAHARSKRVSNTQITAIVPGGNGADGSRAT